jgi:biopolymer transport protein ExbD
MSGAASPLGYALYFIDVLACLLFCLTLALVGARFSREVTLPVDLPRLPESAAAGSALDAADIALRAAPAGPELFYEGERVSFEELEARLAGTPPAAVVVRAEASTLARVIGAVHAAGVRDIQLAYERGAAQEPACCD